MNNRLTFLLFFSCATLMFGFVSTASGLVNIGNASYATSIDDFQFEGVSFNRLYSSNSQFHGIFGKGWCTPYEDKLISLPEGRILILDCASNQELIFQSKFYVSSSLDELISLLLEHFRSSHPSTQESEEKAVLERLKSDWRARKKLAQESGIEIPQLPTETYVNLQSRDTLSLKDGSYTLTNDFSIRTFDSGGCLVRTADSDGKRLTELTYVDQRLKTIKFRNIELNLDYDKDEHVIKAQASDLIGKTYEYNAAFLTRITSLRNQPWFVYDYDEQNHLDKLTYPDNTHQIIEYEPVSGRVLSFTNRKDCVEIYKYGVDRELPSHLWSTVEKKCGEKITVQDKYDFWYDKRSDGSSFAKRVRLTKGATYNEITYSSDGRTTSLDGSGIVTHYKYRQDGFLVEKSTDALITNFEYDDLRRLALMRSSSGRRVKLSYNSEGKLSSIVDEADRLMTLSYDGGTKPVLVVFQGVGSVYIAYENSGEIKEVRSDSGRDVAMAVATAYNNIVDELDLSVPMQP